MAVKRAKDSISMEDFDDFSTFLETIFDATTDPVAMSKEHEGPSGARSQADVRGSAASTKYADAPPDGTGGVVRLEKISESDTLGKDDRSEAGKRPSISRQPSTCLIPQATTSGKKSKVLSRQQFWLLNI